MPAAAVAAACARPLGRASDAQSANDDLNGAWEAWPPQASAEIARTLEAPRTHTARLDGQGAFVPA